MEPNNTIVYDIETTGLDITESVTTTITTLHIEEQTFKVFVNTNCAADVDMDAEERAIRSQMQLRDEHSLDIIFSPNEFQMLSEFSMYLDNVGREDLGVVGWNSGGSYRGGGFDADWLRSVSAKYGERNPLSGVVTMDAKDLVLGRDGLFLKRADVSVDGISLKGDLNTFATEHLGIPSLTGTRDDYNETVREWLDFIEAETDNDSFREEALKPFFEEYEGEIPMKSPNTLDEVHETLVDVMETAGEVDLAAVEYDPIDGNSEEAIEAWRNGEIAVVALHNLADVRMTADAFEIAIQQAPPRTRDNWTLL